MKKPHLGLLALTSAFVIGATIVTKVSDYPNVSIPADTDLFVLASGSTNKNIRFNQLREAIGSSSAPITNLVVYTNSVNVFKGGRVTITNNITILTNGTISHQNLPWPSVLLVGTDGNETNAILSGLTLSGNTLTATGSGSGLVETVVTLGWSTTNITGFDCTTNGVSYYLLLTNNCLFGSSTFSNLPTKSQYRTFVLCLQQDSTGGYTPKFTNSVVKWSEGVQPVITTNAGAVSYLYFHTDLTTNSLLVGSPNLNIK